jgi:hypothetical protein
MKHGKYFMKYSTHLAERNLAYDEVPMTSAVFKDTVKRTALCGLELETCEEIQGSKH